MTTGNLPLDHVIEYRKKTFALLPRFRVDTLDMALEYINARKLIAFWPINRIPCPSLWVSTAGDRPVPNEHDDPGHITWRWKDEIVSTGSCFYGRILCNRYFFVSRDHLKYLYAISDNVNGSSEDHEVMYADGKMPPIAFRIYDLLLNHGAMDTIALKRLLCLSGKHGEYSFNQAMNFLQKGLKVIPVGISNAGRWHYAFVYDLLTSRFPDLDESARKISPMSARNTLIKSYIQSVGLTKLTDLQNLFQWSKEDIQYALDQLIASKDVTEGKIVQHGKECTAYLLTDLL